MMFQVGVRKRINTQQMLKVDQTVEQVLEELGKWLRQGERHQAEVHVIVELVEPRTTTTIEVEG